jgi:tetratricopeptide (TPR) repeat protein
MSQLKPIHKDTIGRAFEKAERYRLLNEPFEAESICLDILAIDPSHAQALGCLLLSLTDQFRHGAAQAMERARALLPRFSSDYEQAYYAGIVSERFARRKLRDGQPGARALAYGYLHEAMADYERAERLAPSGNDDAVLRFNACVRMIERQALSPPLADDHEQPLE